MGIELESSIITMKTIGNRNLVVVYFASALIFSIYCHYMILLYVKEIRDGEIEIAMRHGPFHGEFLGMLGPVMLLVAIIASGLYSLFNMTKFKYSDAPLVLAALVFYSSALVLPLIVILSD